MQVRDLIEELKRFDERAEVRLEILIKGYGEDWEEFRKVDAVKAEHAEPVLISQ